MTEQEIRDGAPLTATHYFVAGGYHYYKVINDVVYFYCLNEWCVSCSFDINDIWLLKPLP